MNKIDLSFIDESSPRNLVATEYILPSLLAWHRMGLRYAIITLVNIVGSSPRALGSLMAVSSEGHSVGYLSGGCLERAIIIEAQRCIEQGRNRLIRYGKGSPYFDIQLPCGSGVDVYIDQGVEISLLTRLDELSRNRKAVIQSTDLETGANTFAIVNTANERSRLDGRVFRRVIWPAVRVYLVGAGPAVPAIAHLLSAVGFPAEVVSPDEATRAEVRAFGLASSALTNATIGALEGDPWTAAILAFHEHRWELSLIEQLLTSDCFYIGVLGSKAVAETRVAELRRRGVGPEKLGRIRAPVGLIAGTKSRLSLAVSVISELVGEAKAREFVA
ncbi:XdhC family protein [Hyphomicrobium sp. 99]|uniref:XdhC family protein n=1 Tax=Hyphomicrobium sp. 99 TaxID=1163419 RepID=UPI000696257D|nr:XdhC family protein [Hyphomicrobium sp. 99]